MDSDNPTYPIPITTHLPHLHHNPILSSPLPFHPHSPFSLSIHHSDSAVQFQPHTLHIPSTESILVSPSIHSQ